MLNSASPLAFAAQNVQAAPSSDHTVLLSQSQTGDLDAFNLLVERYQHRLYTLCFRMLGDADEAADAVQDSFLAAYRNIHRFRGGSFVAWVVRIATNKCYDRLRARGRSLHTSLDRSNPGADEPALQLADPREQPDERVLRQDLARQLQQLLQDLPADQRLAIILSDVQGYSYEEIGDITGVPLGTVKSRISRGRARLRGALHGAQGIAATSL
jgi:RNA polymerase sigma-70 factor (ECF subfamily)